MGEIIALSGTRIRIPHFGNLETVRIFQKCGSGIYIKINLDFENFLCHANHAMT